jgi:hypothetical protein
VQDWSSKTSLPQREWEALIKEKLGKTHMCIVLVGKYMASASGVAKEITMAKEQNVPIFGVYVGGANSTSTLPTCPFTGPVGSPRLPEADLGGSGRG